MKIFCWLAEKLKIKRLHKWVAYMDFETGPEEYVEIRCERCGKFGISGTLGG